MSGFTTGLRPFSRGTPAGASPADTYRITFAAADTAVTNAAASGSIVNTGTGSVAWSITPPSGVTVTPSSGLAIAGTTTSLSIVATAAATYSLSVTAAGATITGNSQSIVVSSSSPTTATLSGSDTASAAVESTYTVTLNAAADQTYTITPSASDSATLSVASFTITAGNTSGSFGVTWPVVGTGRTVDFTISPTLTRAGRPLSVTVADFAWAFADAATQTRGRNMTTVQATGVPAGAVCTVSPDLLPGETLELDGSTLQIVGDYTVPTVDDTRDVVIEVVESPAVATIVNVTQSITYPYSSSYTGRTGSQAANRWNAVMHEAAVNDIIEVSPGAIHGASGDLTNYWSNNLDSSMLAIWKPVTIRGISGRGRWWLYTDDTYASADINGITIYAPGEIDAGRGTFALSDFSFGNWGPNSSNKGIRIRSGSSDGSTFGNSHSGLTVSNFKIGKVSGSSGSGIGGEAETLVIQDGHVFDCGDGGGQEHNLYVSARTMTLRGLHLQRTRGWVGTPWDGGTTGLEGHLAKVSAVNGTIEGCAFNCAPLGDQSRLLQMKAGGNWIVRGNLFRDSAYPNAANGAIMMTREYAVDGITENFEWWAGLEGNSLLFEKNVYIGHYPRPIFYFNAQDNVAAMRPASGGAWTTEERLASFLVRDNLAMVATTAQGAGGTWVLSGFPGTNNALWINNDPNAGTYWAARGNTVLTYGPGEPGFTDDDRRLMMHRRVGGAVAVSTSGTDSTLTQPVSTYRFKWPHGSEARSDAYQGLA